MTTHEYFFELLTEEIPAWMLAPRVEGIRKDLRTFYCELAGRDAAANEVAAGATSRRIWFVMSGLPEREADREEDVKGPPRKMAFDPSGQPTPALNGFLKKNNATSNDIVSGESDDYVRLRRRVTGRATVERIASKIPSLIESIRWPKMMRWGRGEQTYIRPIHSVISLFDGKDAPIEIFGTKSSSRTVGHRVLSPREIAVSSFADYATKLREASVVTDADERVETMRRSSAGLAKEVGGTPAVDDAIWEQWRYLTEYPGIVRAEFPNDYLVLPEEVLTTVMRVHQKQLPIFVGGKLSRHVLAVMDNLSDPDGNAASGNAFVINARFADAKFFYETDRRRPLQDRLEELTHLQFHEKLGNYYEKTKRIETIAAAILRDSEAVADAAGVARAASLSKCDLVTEMVKEFTELQGKIGGIYVREEGAPAEVWQAVYDQYLPVSTESALPRTASGAILSIADRIDTLCGFFLVGFTPTGSKDPFALRRAAQGIVQILLNREVWRLDIGIDRLMQIGFGASGMPVSEADEAWRDLRSFFAERVRTLLESAPFNLAYDEVAAAMEAGWANSLLDLHDRVRAVRSVRGSVDFLSILDSAKRIANITASAGSSDVDASLLEHATEKRLASLAIHVGEQIDELVAEGQYTAALEAFAGMASELETFFNDVMVMVDDVRVRNNRMALLKKVGESVHKIADVTKIVVDRSEYDGKRS